MHLKASLFLILGLLGCSGSTNNGGPVAGRGENSSSGTASSIAAGGVSGPSGISSVTTSTAQGGATGGSPGGSGGASLGGGMVSSSTTVSQTGGEGGTAGPSTAGAAGGRAASGGENTMGAGGNTGIGGMSAGTSVSRPDGGPGVRADSGVAGTGGTSRDGGAVDGASTGGTGEGSYIPDPDWACGMPDGIPSPKQGQLVFSVSLQIGATHDVGNTPYGRRRLLDVKGGTITGDRLKGTVMTGGLEYELVLSNGVVEYQGINIFKTSGNTMIYVRSCGVAPDGDSPPRVIPDFEAATSGSDAWLNTAKLVATRVASAGSIQLDVYDVSKAIVGEPRIRINKPAGIPKQPWDCNKTTGTRGATVFTESVSLGSTFSIHGKRGTRTVIPITGGTTTGKVTGSILPGGADYQNSGSLDAWYTLAPSNGEFILVRNCGPVGKLIPWFEARVDGEFNFLNTNAFLSSDPSMSGGGVGITFYERK